MLNINSSINNEGNKAKAISACSLGAAGAAFGATYNALSFLSLPIEDYFDKVSELSEIETKKVNDGLKKAFYESNLKKKGVKLAFVPVCDGDYLDILNSIQESIKNPKNVLDRQIMRSLYPDYGNKGIIEKLTQNFSDFLSKKAETSPFYKKIYTFMFGDGIELVNLDNFVSLKAGSNAFYTENTNFIFVPEKKINMAGFHEMGHAINDKMFLGTKILQNVQGYCPYIAGGLTIAALLAPDDSDKKDSPISSILSFIKKNIGKLAFLAYMPITLEEGIANINGNKLAKNVLDREIYEKIKKANKLSFLTYLLSAAVIGISAKGAVAAKDFCKSKLQKAFFAKKDSSANCTQD